MPGVIERKIPWRIQPQFPVAIDRSNPFGVVSAFTPIDQRGLSALGAPTDVVSPLGREKYFSANNASLYRAATAREKTPSASILWMGEFNGAATSAASLGGTTYDAANSAPYIGIALKRDTVGGGNVFLSSNNTATFNNLTSGGGYTNGLYLIIGTVTSSAQFLYIKNLTTGVVEKVSAVVSGNIAYAATARFEVGDSLNARNPAAACALLALAGRAWTEAEAQKVLQNPWQIFPPRSHRINVGAAADSLLANLFTDPDAFYVAAVSTTGPQTLTASLFTDPDTFYSAVVTAAGPGIAGAVVSSNGSTIAITLAASATVALSDVIVTMGGYPVALASITGAGTSWTVTLGARWLRGGVAISVAGTGSISGTVAATNNSVINSARVKYVGRQFSMFLHFNMETFIDVEWGTGSESPSTFSPTGNIGSMIDSWIAGAKLAGMKSLCLTAKHHSGFCLWPSNTTTHDIASSSWYAGAGSPDILGMYVQKCRAAGLGVGVYFSIWDRNFEINTPGFTGAQYTAHTQAQLAEILNNYGPIDYLWYDGYAWLGNPEGVHYGTIALTDVYNYPKTIQPNCVIAINDHRHDLSSSDIDVFENYQGYPTVGNPVPGEFAETIRADTKWFWKLAADANKSAASLITEKSTINGRKSHYLLNCPPDRTGGLPVETMRALAGIGANAAEAVDGVLVSSGAGAYPPVSVTVTLTTDGTALAANLTGLTWAFWDSPTPKYQSRPTAQGVNASTNASGVFSVKVYSSLTTGQVGWLVVTNSDGTTTQNPAHKEFSGPVAVT